MTYYELAGVGLALQVCAIYLAVEMAAWRHSLHAWLFISAFVLMAVRRATSIMSASNDAPSWVGWADHAVLPAVISLLLLLGIVAHRRFIRRTVKDLEEKYRL